MSMAYQSPHIDAILAASLGDDPLLMRDLRTAFLQSAQDHRLALAQAASVSEWHMAAWRFKGLCASFGLTTLMELAERATTAPEADPLLLHKIAVELELIAREG
jgi:HPt (histidine-containing phosphotransfer) domain-containing protein